MPGKIGLEEVKYIKKYFLPLKTKKKQLIYLRNHVEIDTETNMEYLRISHIIRGSTNCYLQNIIHKDTFYRRKVYKISENQKKSGKLPVEIEEDETFDEKLDECIYNHINKVYELR